jgi:hypothetical protein
MTYNFTERKPLLHYSEEEERATVFDSDLPDSPMPRRKKSNRQRKHKRRHLGKGLKGVKFSKGRLALRVGGFSGVQRLAPSQLIRFIPLAKLKQAARKVLQKSKGKTIKKRRKSKKRKSQA